MRHGACCLLSPSEETKLWITRARSLRRRTAVAGTLAAVLITTLASGTASATPSAQLTRYPYLTDLTGTSVQVTWATSVANNRGVVQWGTTGSGCATNSATAATSGVGYTITVASVSHKIYQNSVAITGLTPGTSYCYRVFTSKSVSSPVVDLLGTDASPTFKTMPTSANVTFDVLGDWGDTTDASGSNTGTGSPSNVNQAAIDASIASSGALFAVSTGDIGYPNGTVTQYGDLQSTGKDVSSVFGPSYWAQTGKSIPLFPAVGNHGPSATFINTWPEKAVAAASSGVATMQPYTAPDGTTQNYPSVWYAFSVGTARFYVLTASWSDANLGGATAYSADQTNHWTPSSAEYKWLANDLAAHPGGVKFAFFHYPLRSDSATEPGDVYLQNSPANPTGASTSLEKLLNDNKVSLAFNGHAHIYQRNVPPPGGVISYITGGGGAKLSPANRGTSTACSPTNAYSLGWGYTNGTGSSCGAASKPTSISQVFHYLKVTVSGSTVTVTPVNAAGTPFDTKTYNFGADTTAPTGPTTLTATSPKTTSRTLTWNAATDSNLLAYDIYRNGTYLATVPGTVLTYTDTAYVAGVNYTVKARDLAGNVSAGVSGDVTAPSGPTVVNAGTSTASAIPLTWNAATDNVKVTGYRVYRNGTLVSTVTGTSYTDTGLVAGTTYQYRVTAIDAAGNESTPGATTSGTTLGGSSGGTFTLTPTDDATIDPVTTDTLTASRLKADASTPVNDLLMKYTVPASCSSVTSATLTMTVGSGSTDPSVRGGDFYAAASSSWAEGSVTWATAPAKTGSPVSITGAVAASTAYSMDVTSLVPATGGTFTIRGSNTSGDGVGYFSKEGSTTAGPRLQITCG